MQETSDNSKKWSPWPIAIISFFAVAILGAVSFVVFCQFHSTDLVAHDYYEQELRHESQMERARRAAQLGEAARIGYDAGKREIRIHLPQEHARGKATGDIVLYRPSAATLDRRVTLSLDEFGSQVIDVGSLSPGLWNVKLLWKAGGQEYFLDRKVEIGS